LAVEDRDTLAGEHVDRAIRYGRAWARRHDRVWFADEAECAALWGLLAALRCWTGSGSFSALLRCCVAWECRKRFAGWSSGRLLAGPDSAWPGESEADPKAEQPGESLERGELIRAAVAAWRSIESKHAVRLRDETRAFRLLYGLPDSRRGARSSYSPPLDHRGVARKVGRSEAWVRRAEAQFLAMLREQIAI
jgi:hypothetical protein